MIPELFSGDLYFLSSCSEGDACFSMSLPVWALSRSKGMFSHFTAVLWRTYPLCPFWTSRNLFMISVHFLLVFLGYARTHYIVEADLVLTAVFLLQSLSAGVIGMSHHARPKRFWLVFVTFWFCFWVCVCVYYIVAITTCLLFWFGFNISVLGWRCS